MKIVRTQTRAEGGLTPEEKEKMKFHTALWIARAMRTKPIDPAKIVPAIKALYAAANLKEPRVVIVPSPRVMAFAGGFAAAIWWLRKNPAAYDAAYAATHDAAYAATRDATYAAYDAAYAATRAATDAAAYDAAYAATRDAAYAATRAATRDAAYAATRAATRDATYAAYDAAYAATRDATYAAYDAAYAATRDAAYAATRAATHAATYAATDDAAYAATRDAAYAATRAATRDATYAATGDATYAATDDATHAATGDATHAATYAATHAATYAATDDATTDATDDATYAATTDAKNRLVSFFLACATRWGSSYHGGNMWAYYDCYLSAFRDVLGLRLPIFAKYAVWEQCAIEGGFRWMHAEFCIVSDFPAVLKIDNQNRPHCDDGPSHRWRDGWELYYIHGVKVTRQIVVAPESITIAQVRKEDNAEVRRIMIERMGWDKFCSQAKLRVIHTDTMTARFPTLPVSETVHADMRAITRYRKGEEIAELLESEEFTDFEDHPLKFVRVTDPSTGERYILRVWPQNKRAYEAVAQTFGMTEAEYKDSVVKHS